MVKIITIPNDNDTVMNYERIRVMPQARALGWLYAGYNHQPDHIIQIGNAAVGAAIEVLDLDCHGNPTTVGHTSTLSVAAFGQQLSLLAGFSASTEIYLDACNTGLTSRWGGPIAQALANATGCAVYGTQGYITGTFMENTEKCYDTINGLPMYPGARSETGRNVWIKFLSAPAGGRIMTSSINVKTRAADGDETRSSLGTMRGLAEVLETIFNGESVEFPQLRMAPDVTINYETETGVQILDVYANGSLIKDRTTGITWRVSDANIDRLESLVADYIGDTRPIDE